MTFIEIGQVFPRGNCRETDFPRSCESSLFIVRVLKERRRMKLFLLGRSWFSEKLGSSSTAGGARKFTRKSMLNADKRAVLLLSANVRRWKSADWPFVAVLEKGG